MEPTCEHCSNILGCPMLADSSGAFVPERVITTDNYRECPDWEPITEQQSIVRATLRGLQGDGGLRVLHQMAEIITPKPAAEEDSCKEESTDDMNVDMPDFGGMLLQGMMSAEREQQLRYETDEDGQIILEDLGKGETIQRPRPTYQLRKFACDPEGYVQLDHSAGMFWTQDQLIRFILKTEVEQDLITKSKKSKSTEKGTKPKTEKKNMPAGRKVLTRKTKAGAATKGPKVGGSKSSKVSKPPVKRGASAATQELEGLPEVPGIDMEALVEEIQAKVGETVERIVKEKIEALEEQISSLMDGLTILHDFLIQTGGTMQYTDDEGNVEGVPEMYDHEDKILGHLSEGEDEEDPS